MEMQIPVVVEYRGYLKYSIECSEEVYAIFKEAITKGFKVLNPEITQVKFIERYER